MDFSAQDKLFMDEALSLASLSAKDGEVPVGAVVVYDGKIIGRGKNGREKEKNALAHAELEAIDEACTVRGGWRLFGCTLYVTLEPCVMCAGAIVNSRIDRVVYACPDLRFGALGSKIDISSVGLNHTFTVESGLECEHAQNLLRDFFSQLRKK